MSEQITGRTGAHGADGNARDGASWTACRTLNELGNDRPPFGAWLRHLGRLPDPPRAAGGTLGAAG